MKLTGYDIDSAHNRKTVRLSRTEESGLPEIELTVEALPSNYWEELEREIPDPVPPQVGVERDSSGKPMTDEQGRPVPKFDWTDETYRRKQKEAQSLQSVKMVVDGLADGEVAFDAEKDPQDPVAYYRAVQREMQQFGFNLGDVVKLARAVQKVSNISGSDIEEAMDGFFGEDDSASSSSNGPRPRSSAGAGTAGAASPAPSG